MSTHHLVVTVTCPDRPGVVERLTEVAVAQGANWEESRMARLGGHFAGIVCLSVASPRCDALKSALESLSGREMAVVVTETAAAPAGAAAGCVPYVLELSGADHEGIVNEVARFLAAQGINVESLDTQVFHAPVSGTPLFRMKALLLAPRGVTLASLRSRLHVIGDELGVDIDVGAYAQGPKR